MRVLFVHFGDGDTGGSEVSLLETMSALAKRGVDVHLYCNTNSMEEPAAQRGIRVYRGEFTPYFDYSSRAFSLKGYFAAVTRARRVLAEAAPDLIHCNSAEPAQSMRLASWLHGAPMLVYLHGRYLRRSRYVLGLHLADRIIGVTRAMVDPLQADGVEPARLGVVYNGFDADALLAGDAAGLRAELGIPRDAVVGAVVGGLFPWKGHDVLIAGLRELGTLPRPVHILVVGEGRVRAQLETLAAGLPVHFLGHRSDVGAVLRDAADFLVAPSRHEGFGRAVIEAALAGIPAIGARVGGIPEAIEDGATGLLVAPESPTEIATAIARLVCDEALRRRMGRAAESRARERFLVDRVTGEMQAQYSALLDAPRPSVFDMLRPTRLAAYSRLLLNHGETPGLARPPATAS